MRARHTHDEEDECDEHDQRREVAKATGFAIDLYILVIWISKDFGDLAALRPGRFCSIPQPPAVEYERIENPSISARGLQIALGINPHLHNARERRVTRLFLQEHFSNQVEDRARPMPEELRQSVTDQTAAEYDEIYKVMLKKLGLKTSVTSISEVATEDQYLGLSGSDLEAVLVLYLWSPVDGWRLPRGIIAIVPAVSICTLWSAT